MRRSLWLLSIVFVACGSACVPPAEFVPDPLVSRRGPPRESIPVVDETPAGSRLAGVLSARGPEVHQAILARAAAEGCDAVHFHIVYENSPDIAIRGEHVIGDCLVFQ